MAKIIIGDWGIGITTERTTEHNPRVYIEYQAMDETPHNEHDIRLYINGNFGSIISQIAYAKVVVAMLIKGKS